MFKRSEAISNVPHIPMHILHIVMTVYVGIESRKHFKLDFGIARTDFAEWNPLFLCDLMN